MPQITYILTDGTRQTINVDAGAVVMHTAIANGIPGIIAECGGSAMCATCHVYVDPSCMQHLPPVSEVENEMLDSAASERRENSRLSCQLIMDGELEELIIHIPERQV